MKNRGEAGACVPRALDRAGRLADGFTGCCAPVDALISMMQAVKEAARERGRDADNMPIVMRCLVTRTETRVDDANRPVTVGTWDQIRDDVLRMQEAGVTEAFFDVAFQPDAQTQRGLMQYLERFRTIMESPVHA